MNKNETLQVLHLMDQSIDCAEHSAVMLAADALRRHLMDAWQQGLCADADGALLEKELAALPALCRSGLHPALPTKLCHTLFLLFAPHISPAKNMLDQCRIQAAKLRSLRRWRTDLTGLITQYDEATARETENLLLSHLSMMEDVFTQLLQLHQGRMAVQTAQRRAACREELAALRESLCVKDVSDAQADTMTVIAMTREKFFELAPDIVATESFIEVNAPPDAALPQQTAPDYEEE